MYRLLLGYSGLIAAILSFIKWIDSAASCFITDRRTACKTYLNIYTAMHLASLKLRCINPLNTELNPIYQ